MSNEEQNQIFDDEDYNRIDQIKSNRFNQFSNNRFDRYHQEQAGQQVVATPCTTTKRYPSTYKSIIGCYIDVTKRYI